MVEPYFGGRALLRWSSLSRPKLEQVPVCPTPRSGTLPHTIWTRPDGDGSLLVLLHGLGATAEAWRGVEELLPDAWSGGWLAVDLPGHGRSSWAPPYTFEAQGAGIDEILPEDRDPVVFARREVEGGWRVAQDPASFDLDDPVTLDGLGHNPHVEDPAAVAGLLSR